MNRTFARQFGKYLATLTIRPAPYINSTQPHWSPKKPTQRQINKLADDYSHWMIDCYRAVAKETGLVCIASDNHEGVLDGYLFRPNGATERIVAIEIVR